MILAPELQSLISHYLPPPAVTAVEPLGNAGGWSGSRLWRVTASGEPLPARWRGLLGHPLSDTCLNTFCLRRWPRVHPSPERLRQIHSILTHVVAQGIVFVPVPLPSSAGATAVEQAGHLWELTPWMPGAADYHQRPGRVRLAAAMESLARFHAAAATVECPRNASALQPAPALTERLQSLEELVQGRLSEIEFATRRTIAPQLDQRAEQLLNLTPDRLQPLLAHIRSVAGRPLPLQPAIRDIWHDHVLFTGDEVTGIVDFGAMRIDTPLTDIARLVGSLVGDDNAERRFALNAYSRLKPLSGSDCQLIDLLDQSGIALGGLNWLRWLYLERRDMGPLDPILKRLDAIIGRLRASAPG